MSSVSPSSIKSTATTAIAVHQHTSYANTLYHHGDISNNAASNCSSSAAMAAHVSSEPCLNTYLVEQQLHHHCTLALSQQLQQRHTT
eukprot:7116-Heterococcus_DN1.PRE.1